MDGWLGEIGRKDTFLQVRSVGCGKWTEIIQGVLAMPLRESIYIQHFIIAPKPDSFSRVGQKRERMHAGTFCILDFKS